jgi:2-polyprenyl-3-methyl-5-hydroxy-6-metoxy-1,4-benzoquinol methylase
MTSTSPITHRDEAVQPSTATTTDASATSPAGASDAENAELCFSLAQLLLTSGHREEALIPLAKAVRSAPGRAEYLRQFAAALTAAPLRALDADLKEALRLVLESPAVVPALASAWYRALWLDDGTRGLLTLLCCEKYEEFARRLTDLAGQVRLADPLFLAGLRHLLFSDLAIERFLTQLRRFLLADAAPAFTVDERVAVAAALAQYCHYTSYVFHVGVDEEERVDALEAGLADPIDPVRCREAICLLACYRPLYQSRRAGAILSACAADPLLGPLVQALIAEPAEESAIAARIQPLTAIEDEVSQKVQQQYLEFPYPRWRWIDPDKRLSSRFASLGGERPEILIAGCGTGLEVLYYSIALPSSRILAVDLSQASLAYAIRKAAEYGVDNIDFRQADILALPAALDRQFDIVSSSGVLHHLDDPERGFDVLYRLVKPGGLMRICLYSELGRRHLVTAQRAVVAHQYAGTVKDIRRFRNDCPRLIGEEAFKGVTRASDFFILPNCRDLLFHVMEHRFDIPRLQALLGRYQLEFLEFVLDDSVLQQYRVAFPDDPEATSLDNWARFESAHPDTFFGMYKFVCQKRS